MSVSIFVLELSNLFFSDIKAFCDQGISEGLRLDYKEMFPTKIERTICAFANTVGGIILIGVKADKKTNKPINIPGIELTNGLEEKVINICLSHISPPAVPEVKVCGFKSNSNKSESDRAVLFIRVREADFTSPHYLLNSNEILIRAHNRNSRADLRTIEMLLDRRESANGSTSYFNAYYGGKEVDVITENGIFESVIFSTSSSQRNSCIL